METEEFDIKVVWSGKDPLLPPRSQRPQEPQKKVREKRMYNKKSRLLPQREEDVQDSST